MASALLACALPARAATQGERLVAAARRQIGITTGYDPAYRKLAYPGGDVARTTGVCADVIVRAARDGLGLDLQRLVHEDMGRAFTVYIAHRNWRLTAPDSNIDHRRVPNLETYWRRTGAELWRASGLASGAGFPGPLHPGDILTWRAYTGAPHVAIVSRTGWYPRIIHNMGEGAREVPLWRMWAMSAYGHYRWPA